MPAEKERAPQSLEIVEMTPEDLEQVIEIEAWSFPSPWPMSVFLYELRSSLSHNIVAKTGEVHGGAIAGYLNYWIVSDEVHIHHIAVRRDMRRMGIASELMLEMIRRAIRNNGRWGTLEVRPSNLGAIRLYEKFGFKIKGVRPRYYSDTGEDALIMWAHLGMASNHLRVAS
jgi:ribosomal-protein-alanine N-acetyltransferase